MEKRLFLQRLKALAILREPFCIRLINYKSVFIKQEFYSVAPSEITGTYFAEISFSAPSLSIANVGTGKPFAPERLATDGAAAL